MSNGTDDRALLKSLSNGSGELDRNNLPIKEDRQLLRELVPVPDMTIGVEDFSASVGGPQPEDFKKYSPSGQFFAGEDIMEMVAQNQPYMDKIANGAVRLIGGTATKFLTGVGHVGGLLTGGIEGAIDNAWSDLFIHAEESLKEAYPIYHTQKYHDSSVWKQMGMLQFWMDDVIDGAAFMASAYLPGPTLTKLGLIGKGGKTAQAARAFNNAINLQKAGKGGLGLLKGFDAAKFAHGMDLGAIITWNTISEAAFEARDTKEQIMQSLTGKVNPETGTEYTFEEMNEIAARGARGTFFSNAAVLAVPNAIQAHMFFGGPKSASKYISSLYKNGTLTAEEVAKLSPSMARTIGKNVATGIVSEGLWEENVQKAIQDFEAKKGRGEATDGRFSEIAANMVDNLFTDEGHKAIVLGAILGGGMGVFGGIREARQDKAGIDRAVQIKQKLEASDALYPENIKQLYKTREVVAEDGTKSEEIIIDPQTGKPELNAEAINKLAFQTFHHKEIFDQMLVAAMNNDAVGYEYLRNIQLSREVWRHLQEEDGIEHLKSKLAFAHKQTAEGEQEGGDKQDNLVRKMKENEALIDNIVKLYDATIASNSVLTLFDETSPLETQFDALATKAQFYEGVKQISLKKILSGINKEMTTLGDTSIDNDRRAKLEKQVESIEASIKDSEDAYNDLKNDKTRKELKKDFVNERKSLEDLGTQVNEIEDKIKDTEDPAKKKELELEREKIFYTFEEKVHIEGDTRYNSNVGIAYDGLPGPGVQPSTKGSENITRERLKASQGSRTQRFFKRGMDALVAKRALEILEEFRKGNVSVLEAARFLANNLTYLEGETLEAFVEVVDAVAQEIEATEAQITDLTSQRDELRTQVADIKVMTTDADGFPIDVYADPINGPALEVELNNAIKEINSELEKLGRKLQELKDVSEDVFTGIERNDARATEIEQAQKDLDETRLLQREYGNLVLNDGKNIRDKITRNPEGYTNSNAILQYINKLNRYLRVALARPEITQSPEFEGYVKSLEEEISDMTAFFVISEQNKRNRQAKQELIDENDRLRTYSSIGIGFTEEGVTYDDTILDIIKEGIGEKEVNELLAEAATYSVDGKDYNYPRIYADLIILKFKDKAKADTKKALTDLLKGRINGEIATIPTMDVGTVAEDYKANPLKVVSNYVGQIVSSNTIVGGKENPITQYERHRDAFILLSDLEAILDYNTITTKPETVDQLIVFLKIHESIEAMVRLKDILSNNYSISDEVSGESAYLSRLTTAPGETVVTPTKQQLITIRQLGQFLSSKTSPEKFHGMAVLVGAAGTGKTSVALKWMMEIAQITPEQIIAVGHNASSSSTIHKSIQPSHDAMTVDTLLATLDTTVKDYTKVIIFDEAAAILDSELINFAEVISILNKDRVAKGLETVKVVLSGDPTQLTRSGIRALDSVGITGIENLTFIQPLSIQYRSNVSSINETSDVFQDERNEITGLMLQADKALGESSPIGVHTSAMEQDLGVALAANKANGKSKLIITNTQAEADALSSKYGVEAQTMVNAQGRTVQEVYVMIKRNGPNTSGVKLFDNPYDFNTAVYTAISRAEDYVFLYDNTGTFEQSQPTPQNVESNVQEITDNHTEFKFQRAIEHDVLKRHDKNFKGAMTPAQYLAALSKTEATTDPETGEELMSVTEDGQDSYEDFLEDEEDYHNNMAQWGNQEQIKRLIPPGQYVTTDGKGSVHRLKEPTFYFLKPGEGMQTGEQNIVPGSKARYLRTKDGVLIVGEVSTVDTNGNRTPSGTWGMIGVLSDEEAATDFGKALIAELDAQRGGEFSSLVGSKIRGKIQGGKIKGPAGIEGTIAVASAATFIYRSPTKDANGDTIDSGMVDQGKGMIKRLLNKLYKGLFTLSGNTTPTDTMENLSKVHIFTRAEIEEWGKENRFPKGFTPTPGIPYLVIEDAARKTKGTKGVIQPVLIKLNVRALTPEDQEIKDIIEFSEAIDRLEASVEDRYMMGDAVFNELLTKFRLDFKVNDTTKKVEFNEHTLTYAELKNITLNGKKVFEAVSEEDFTKFQEASKELIPMLYGYGYSPITVTAAEVEEMGKADATHTYTFKASDKDPNVGRAYKVANADLGKKKPYIVKAPALKAGQGRAQHSFNLIAKANEYVNGSPIRSERSEQIGGKTYKITSGYPLVGTSITQEESDRLVFRAYMYRLRELLRVNKVKAEGFVYQATGAVARLEELVLAKTSVTREQLDTLHDTLYETKLMTSDVVRTIAEGAQYGWPGMRYLRKPLQRRGNYNEKGEVIGKPGINDLDLNKPEDVAQLEDVLYSRFEDFYPTEVIITTEVKATPPPPNTTPPSGTPPSTGRGRRRTFTNKGTLGKRITQKEAIQLLHKMLPETRKMSDTSLVMQFLTKVQMQEKEHPTEELFGLYEDGKIFMRLEEAEDGSTFIYENVLRHEIMHKIFNEYLSPAERQKIIDAIIQESPGMKSASVAAIDEYLAEKFQDYRRGDRSIASRIQSFFRAILRFFGIINGNVDVLTAAFNRVEDGKYTQPRVSPPKLRRTLHHIRTIFKDTKTYRAAMDIVLEELELESEKGEYIDKEHRGTPMTIQQTVDQVRESVSSGRMLREYEDELASLEPYAGVTSVDKDIAIVKDKIRIIRDILGKPITNKKGSMVINLLLQEIFPNLNLLSNTVSVDTDVDAPTVQTEEGDEIPMDESEGVDDKGNSLSEDIMLEMFEDKESKISNSVKNFLSFINYKKIHSRYRKDAEGKNVKDDEGKDIIDTDTEGKTTYVSARYGYKKMLQITEFVDFNNLTSKELKEKFEEYIKYEGAGQAAEAVIGKIQNTFDTAESDFVIDDRFELSNQGRFENEDTFIYKKEGELPRMLSEAVKDGNTFVIRRNPDETTYSFTNRVVALVIADEVSLIKGVDAAKEEEYRNTVVLEMYKKTLAAEEIRAIATHFNSQRELNMYSGIVEFSGGKYRWNYRKSGVHGEHAGTIGDIKHAITQALRPLEGQKFSHAVAHFKGGDNAIRTAEYSKMISLLESTDQTTGHADRIEAIKIFLKIIRRGYMGDKLDTDDKLQVGIVAENLKHALGRLDTATDIIKKTKKTSTPVVEEKKEEAESPEVTDTPVQEEESREYTAVDYVSEENKFLKSLARLIDSETEYLRNDTVANVEGKKIYTFVNTGFAHEVLKSFARNHTLGNSGRYTRSTIPTYLVEENRTAFMNHNPFIKNKDSKVSNYIETVIDHDGVKKPHKNVMYRGENRKEFMERNFLLNFVAFVNAGQKDKTEYVQQMYTPSNKPSLLGAVVGIIPQTNKKAGDVKGDISDFVERMILQTMDRSTVLGNKLKNYDPNNLVNFSALREVLGKDENGKDRDLVKKPIKKSEVPSLTKKVILQLEKEAVEMAELLIDEQISLPYDTHAALAKLRKGGFINPALTGEIPTKSGKKGVTSTTKGPGDTRPYILKAEDILPLVDAFYKNHYVNSFFMNQLFVGDYAQFKDSLELVKRMSGTTSPGVTPFVNNKFGMREKRGTLVLKADRKAIEDYEEAIIEMIGEEAGREVLKSFKKEMETSDGASWWLPEFREELIRGTGKEYGAGNVFKPSQYSIVDKVFDGEHKEQVSVMLKYAAVVLSDELIMKDGEIRYPRLYTLRENIRNLSAYRVAQGREPVMEVVADSAIKVGLPQETLLPTFEEMTRVGFVKPYAAVTEDVEVVNDDAPAFKEWSTFEDVIYDMPNADLRLQFNPEHDVEGARVANPTQIEYFMNILNDRMGKMKATEVYKKLRLLMAQGLEDFEKHTNSKESLREFLLDNMVSKGTERIHEYLESDVSINHPTITLKAIIQASAMLSSVTTKVKFPGAKMSLQSADGMELVDKDGKPTVDLEYKEYSYNTGEVDNEGNPIMSKRVYAEALVPYGLLTPEQEKAVEEGKELFLLPDLLGFRLPSSELHSAIALKVKGFYSAKSQKSSVIVVPHLVVEIHGADFDIDALYVLMKEQWKDEDGFIDNGDGTVENIIKKDSFVGYTPNKINSGLLELDVNFDEKLDRWEKASEGNVAILKKIRKARAKFAKNFIVDSFIEAITNADNPSMMRRMFRPISQDRIKSSTDANSIFSKLVKVMNANRPKGTPEITVRDIQPRPDLSSVLGNMKAHGNNFTGNSLTGGFANAMKSLAYSVSSSEDGGAPVLSNPDLEIMLNGETFDEMSEYFKEEGLATREDIWGALDSLLNAAIDNVKEQVLPILNINQSNFNMLIGLLSLGVPLYTATLLMRQPIMHEFSKSSGKASENVSKVREALLNRLDEAGIDVKDEDTMNALMLEVSNVSVTDTLLEAFVTQEMLPIKDIKLGKGKHAVANLRKSIVEQLAVLEQVSKAAKIGEDIGLLSTSLSILKDYPVLAEEIEEKISDWNSIFTKNDDGTYSLNESFAFSIPKLFENNPHIEQARIGLEVLGERIERLTMLHSTVMKEIAKAIPTSHLEMDRNSFKDKVMKRGEFMKYLVAAMYDSSNEEPYTYINRDGEERTVTGNIAWAQRFVNKVSLLKEYLGTTGQKNIFIDHLFVENEPFSSLLRTRFTGGGNMHQADIIDMEEAFNALSAYDVTDKGVKPSQVVPQEVKGITTIAGLIKNSHSVIYSNDERHSDAPGAENKYIFLSEKAPPMEELIPDAERQGSHYVKQIGTEEKPETLKLYPIIDGVEHYYLKALPDVHIWIVKDIDAAQSQLDAINKKGAKKLSKVVTKSQNYTQMQQDFVKYGALRYGMKFGLVNFSIVLPANLQREFDIDLNNQAQEVLNNVKDTSKEGIRDSLGSIIDHFTIELSVNYTDGLPQAKDIVHTVNEKGDKIYNGWINTGTENLFYDLVTDSESSPEILRSGKFVYIKVKKFDTKSYYQLVGSQNRSTVYESNNSILHGDDYSLIEAFRPDYIHMQTSDHTKDEITMTPRQQGLWGFVVGSRLSLSTYSDVARSHKRYVEVIGVGEGTIKVKTVTAEPYVNKLKDNTFNIPKELQKDSEIAEMFKKVEDAFAKTSPIDTVKLRSEARKLRNRLAKKYHPDTTVDMTSLEARTAAMAEVNNIYDYFKSKYNLQKQSEMSLLTYEHALHITADLQSRFGIKIDIINDPTKPAGGIFKGVAFINIGKAGIDTPFHEIAHPFLEAIKKTNEALYKNLVIQITETARGKAILNRVMELYPDYDAGRQLDEAIVQAIGEYAGGVADTTSPSLWRTIKTFLRRVAEFLGLAGEGNLNIEELNPNMSLKDIGSLIASKDTRLSLGSFSTTEEQQRTQRPREGTTTLQDVDARSKEFKVNAENTAYEHIFDKNRTLERTGEFLNGAFSVSEADKKKTIGEKVADFLWQEGLDKTTKLNTKEGLLDYTEYAQVINDNIENSRKRGIAIHAKIQMHAITDPMAKRALNIKVNQITAELGVTPQEFDWVDESMDDILRHADINVETDDVLAEAVVWNELLQVGGTIDMLTRRPDGRYSIKDWKTGSSFNASQFNNILKYGRGKNINMYDNPREKAKLQVMFYALLLKASHPDMKFTDLQVLWIPGRFAGSNDDIRKNVEVKEYLVMLEKYLMNEKPEEYKKLKEASPDLFNETHYIDGNRPLSEEIREGEKDVDKILAYNIEKLRVITNNTKDMRNLPREVQETVRQLTKNILDIKKDYKVDLDSYTDDITHVQRWLATYDELNNPVMQTYKKIQDEYKERASDKFRIKYRRFRALLLPVYNEYLQRTGKAVISKATFNKLNFVNEAELYGFMWKSRQHEQNFTYEDFVTEQDPEWGTYTEAQKKFSKYVRDEFAAPFQPDGIAHRTAVTVERKDGSRVPLSALEIFNESNSTNFTWSPSFAPRVPMTYSEVSAKHSLFSKDGLSYIFDKYFTMFFEDTFEQWNKTGEALPLKYLGSNYLLSTGYHSKNIEVIFDRYVRAMINKEFFEEALAIGRGIQVQMSKDTDDEGKPIFKNAIGFLEDKLYLDLLDKKRITDWSRRGLNLPAKSARGDGASRKVSVDKVLRTIRRGVAAPIMWLKPILGMRNGLFVWMVNQKDALAGSIADRGFTGIDHDEVDFTIEDMAFAHKEWMALQKDAMFGNIHKNKNYLLSRKFRYLPDNFDWSTNPDHLLTTRNRVLTEGSLFAFHTVFEEWHAGMVMTAQMNRMKNSATGKSIYESYEVKTWIEDGVEVTDVVWVGGKRGMVAGATYDTSGELEELTELTSQEIQRMKRVYQRMHGGYRRDERTPVEAYVLGEIILQFKKYMPGILNSLLKSKGVDASLGTYKRNEDLSQKEGEDVYTWVGRVTEGRWRTLLMATLAFLPGINNIPGIAAYKLSVLEGEQKANLIHAATTLLTYFGLLAGWFAAFKDVDDDDSWKKMTQIVLQNFSQTYNPMDHLRNLKSGVIVPSKAYDMLEGFSALSFSLGADLIGQDDYAFTKQGVYKGWTKVERSTPILSSWRDIRFFLEHDKSLGNDYFLLRR